jgi:filamentous hemagglutinin family protein
MKHIFIHPRKLISIVTNISHNSSLKLLVRSISISLGLLSALTLSASAQITATTGAESTGTTFATGATPNTIDIKDGKKSSDNKNLFHSFSEFNVKKDQTANFISTPDIQNILGRVDGANGGSLINGKLQVTGNANLFLMNPAGIVFGKDASLDINGAFTATTAKAIDFGNGKWFNAVGANTYPELNGNPIGLAFPGSTPGSIFSAATFDGSPLDPTNNPTRTKQTAKPGQSITLVGGTVISTGDIKTAGGNISISTVEGGKYVQIKSDGSLLRLDLPASATSIAPDAKAFTALSLPELLTKTEVDLAATGVKNENGVVTLVGNPAANALVPDLDKALAASKKARADYEKASADYDKALADYNKALTAVGENSALVDPAIINARDNAQIARNNIGDIQFKSDQVLLDTQKTFNDLATVGEPRAISDAIALGDTVSKQNRSVVNGDIITRNLDASGIGEKGGNINIESLQAIMTREIDTSSNILSGGGSRERNGGNVDLKAQTEIKAGNINSSTENLGDTKATPAGERPKIRVYGGNVSLVTKTKDIIIDSIDTTTKGGITSDISVSGGNVNIESKGLFRAVAVKDDSINTSKFGNIKIIHGGTSFVNPIQSVKTTTNPNSPLFPGNPNYDPRNVNYDGSVDLFPKFSSSDVIFVEGASGTKGRIISARLTNGFIGVIYTSEGFKGSNGLDLSIPGFSIKSAPPEQQKNNPDEQASKPKSKENCTPSSTSVASNPTAAPTRSAGNANAVSADPCQQNTSNSGILQILNDRE